MSALRSNLPPYLIEMFHRSGEIKTRLQLALSSNGIGTYTWHFKSQKLELDLLATQIFDMPVAVNVDLLAIHYPASSSSCDSAPMG